MDSPPEKKRLYVSGLFDGIKEEDLVEKFSKFGQVESVDLKARRNEDEQPNSNYAFLEMLITNRNLAKCFNVYSNTRWKGCPLKLEVAKESFLSRLQKEREQSSKKPQPTALSDSCEQKPATEVITLDNEEAYVVRIKSRKQPTDSPSSIQSLSPDSKLAKKNRLTNGLAAKGEPLKLLKHDGDGQHSANQKPQDGSLLSRLEKFSGIWNDFEVVGTEQASRKPQKVVTIDEGESDENNTKSKKRPASPPSLTKNSKNKVPMFCGTATLLQDKTSESVSPDPKTAKKLKLVNGLAAKSEPPKQPSVPSSSAHDVTAKKFASNANRGPPKLDARNGQHLANQKPQGSDLLARLEKFGGIWNDVDVVGSEARTSTLGNVSEKKMLSDKKRLESIQSKMSESNAKQKLIKDALKNLDKGTKTNSKIVFGDEIEDKKTDAKLITSEKQGKKKSVKETLEQPNMALFDSDSEADSVDSQDMFKVKPQYEGEAGQKIIALQSRFGNDERFKIDERFIDADSEVEQDEELNSKEETQRHMGVLESVLGYELPQKPKDHLAKGWTKMKNLRYDPTQKNAAELEIHKDEPSDVTTAKRKGKASKVSEDEALPEVSQERYYKVNTSLKDIFNSGKTSETQPFSLLQSLGAAAPSKDIRDLTEVAQGKAINLPRTAWDSNPFKYDSSSDEEGEMWSSEIKKTQDNKKTPDTSNKTSGTSSKTPAKGNKVKPGPPRKTFFIFDGDHRLEDGVKFFTAPENQDELHRTWAKTRFKLMEDFRERLKKAQQEKNGKTKMASAAKQKFDTMHSKFKPKKKVFSRKRQ